MYLGIAVIRWKLGEQVDTIVEQSQLRLYSHAFNATRKKQVECHMGTLINQSRDDRLTNAAIISAHYPFRIFVMADYDCIHNDREMPVTKETTSKPLRMYQTRYSRRVVQFWQGNLSGSHSLAVCQRKSSLMRC